MSAKLCWLLGLSNPWPDHMAMLSFTGSLQIFLALDPIDRRAGFEGLCATEAKQTQMRLAPEAFAMLTDGIDMHKAKMRPWYARS